MVILISAALLLYDEGGVADRQIQLIAGHARRHAPPRTATRAAAPPAARRPPPRHACACACACARAGKRYRAFSFSLGNSFPSGECYMRDVQCERAGCHSERPPSMKPPSCGACGGHPIPNICAKPFGVGWRLCASEQRVGAFEGCRSAHDHLGIVHSCSLSPSPRRGPVDGTDSAPTKSLQARQVGRRGVLEDSLKLGLPQCSTT